MHYIKMLFLHFLAGLTAAGDTPHRGLSQQSKQPNTNCALSLKYLGLISSFQENLHQQPNCFHLCTLL